MPELPEEQETAGLDFARYLDIIRRRHIHFLIPLFFGWVIVWGISWVLPAQYKSSTLILVEEPTMPEKYVAPNVNENLQDRLQSITQQILSRTRLLTIIDGLQLYSGSRMPVAPDDKVDRMRKDISVDLVKDARNNEITAFKISYSARNPKVAQAVTNELSRLFITENLKVRQAQSEGTTKFIEQQLEDAHQVLSMQEAKVRAFETAHNSSLPSQKASNLAILSGLQSQLQNEHDSLNSAKQQKIYLQTLIEQYRGLHATTHTMEGAPSDLATMDQELVKLRSQLADLSSKYTDSYPDVQKLKSQIAKTEKAREELAATSPTRGVVKQSFVPDGTTQPALLQLQGQLRANDLEITNRERAVAALEERINDYQARLNEAPATEQQLAELTRGYDQSKANYDDLLKKKNESVMATSMEQMQQGERFTILDPPSLPTKPDFPNRLKFCGMGLAAGIAFGLVIVALFEIIDDRMHSEKEIKALLPISVLSEIPEILGTREEQGEKKRIAIGVAAAIFVIVSILVGSTFSYLRG
jgi:polysaccharide chain length determinant protein (PEP-CTERM system associated)